MLDAEIRRMKLSLQARFMILPTKLDFDSKHQLIESVIENTGESLI